MTTINKEELQIKIAETLFEMNFKLSLKIMDFTPNKIVNALAEIKRLTFELEQLLKNTQNYSDDHIEVINIIIDEHIENFNNLLKGI